LGQGVKGCLLARFGEGGGGGLPMLILAKPVRACKPKNLFSTIPKSALFPLSVYGKAPRGAEVPEWGHRWACLYIYLNVELLPVHHLRVEFLTLKFDFSGRVEGRG